MNRPEFWRAIITAVLAALLAHAGFQVSPPPVKPIVGEDGAPKKKADPKKKPKPDTDGNKDEEEEGDAAPAPKPKKKPKPKPEEKPAEDVKQAIGRIQFGTAGCTANIIGPRRKDGRYDVLTAAHCVKAIGTCGVMELRNGKRFAVCVAAIDRKSDCCWLRTDGTHGILPFALLADATPEPGTPIWHAGFGIDVPGNTERGTLRALPNSDGQVEYELSVSPGDSGGAIVADPTGRVISPVCCTSALAQRGRVWGASPESCARLRPRSQSGFEWTPIPMPLAPSDPMPMPMPPLVNSIARIAQVCHTY